MNQQEAENFIRVWQTSNSRVEVIERLNLSARQIDGRAYRLRKKGVELKTHGDAQGPLDVDALKKLAESLSENRNEA